MAEGTITVRLVGTQELERNWSRFNLITQQRAADIIKRSTLNIQNNAKRFVPVDMGRLRSSINTAYYNNGLSAQVQAHSNYAAFVEFGTGPRGRQMNLFAGPLPDGYTHGSGGKMPPIELILAWIKRKGIRPKGPRRRGVSREAEQRALAYVIARSIGRRGLFAKPFMYPAYLQEEGNYEREMKKLLDGVSL